MEFTKHYPNKEVLWDDTLNYTNKIVSHLIDNNEEGYTNGYWMTYIDDCVVRGELKEDRSLVSETMYTQLKVLANAARSIAIN